MIAAIVALFALRETRIQRESMYKPNLSIADGVFYADISDIKSIKYYQDGIDTLIMGHTPAYILHDSSGLNVPPVSLSNVPGIAESIVPPIAETNVPGVSL